MEQLTYGLWALVLSGILNGSFAAPMKAVKKWKWENIWSVFGLVGLVLLPILMAVLTLPRLFDVYRTVGTQSVSLAAGLGIAWGIGSLLFGLAISSLGMSLGYAIIMGATAVFGTLIPALAVEPGIVVTRRGAMLAASLSAIVLGLVLCAIAGRRRDRLHSAAPGFRILTSTSFTKGMLMCLLSGALSACFNIGFALTLEISRTAERFGASASNSTFAIWAVIMSAGYLPSLVYCLHLFQKHRSLSLFRVESPNWLHGFAMALMWVLSVKFYGSGANSLGARGAAIGWPILMSVTIITANVVGFVSGEWTGVTRTTRRYIYSGLMALLSAVLFAASAGLHM